MEQIGSWFLKKGIWFVIVLLGFLAYYNFYVRDESYAHLSADATLAENEAPNVRAQIEATQAASIKAVEEAKSLAQDQLEQRIQGEEANIEALQKSLDTTQEIDISAVIYQPLIKAKLEFANWKKRQYTLLRDKLLTEDARAMEIPIKEVELQQKQSAYATKKAEYDQKWFGAPENSMLNLTVSKATSLINIPMELTDWEIKDPNKAYNHLMSLYQDLQNRQIALANLRNPVTVQLTSPPDAGPFLNKVNEVVLEKKNSLNSNDVKKNVIDPLKRYWKPALLTVILGIIFSPLARLICFYVLAPIAARQAPVALEPHSKPASIDKKHAASATSLTLDLTPGDVLLAHHDFAKGIPKGVKTNTRLFLDWSSPFTSLASGLYNLVRIKPTETITMELSAGHDGLNELTSIKLDAGEGMVVEARNVVGVVISDGQSVTLTKHWAIRKLQSWLKWQFRYITITGPITLTLKGGRGLVVSHIHDELTIAPDYVVAYSSNLGYATSRTETFGGYFSRKKHLLNDRFVGDSGIVIHQEANFADAIHAKKSGLEGIMDGLLKAFGI